ncbi:MAG: homoserine dehydrogenase [Spirochaetes bacterium]|nr:homoserine dehydrogenase [Spirochaetota bacterium]MBN2771451.1 homoserine dehydrogenase [Spirochaetota bacterium]
MKKKVNIGLVGFGTVGSGVYNVIKNNGKLIEQRTGVSLVLKTVCDLRMDEVKKTVSSDVQVTDNWKSLIEDKDIDTIVELIGGLEPAKSVVEAALSAGKNVVTANKKLLAEKGSVIFELADRKDAKLGFEAAVGGGIPCIEDLKNGLVANNVNHIFGILNGTTNYILTRMELAELSFADALAEAQAEGFAEADPTFDIEGFDAGHKICLLAMLAFNKKIEYGSIEIEGITKIKTLDTEFARRMGYAVKLLGIAREIDGEVDVRVHPVMIRESHLIASVSHEYNAVVFDADMTGEVLLYGKGAGSLPTASAVVSDIVQIAVKKGVYESAILTKGDAVILGAEKRFSRFYLRINTEDRPGILEKVAHAFSANNISVSSVEQHETGHNIVPLLFVTHKACEADIKKAVREINSFDFVTEPVMMIRIEES